MIGLNSFIDVGSLVLGIRVMIVGFQLWSESSSLRSFKIIEKMPSPIVSQTFWKKRALKPSGPGALEDCGQIELFGSPLW